MTNKSESFFLLIDGRAVRVPEAVFRDYKKYERKERYFSRDLKRERVIRDRRYETVIIIPARETSLEYLVESGYQFSAPDIDPFEDHLARMEMLDLLASAMEILTPEERELILELYYRGRTERAVGEARNIPYTTVHSRKKAILQKMRDFVERFI